MPIRKIKTDRPNCANDRRVGLRLPSTLHASLEDVAVKRGVPLSLLVRTALEREVTMHQERAVEVRAKLAMIRNMRGASAMQEAI